MRKKYLVLCNIKVYYYYPLVLIIITAMTNKK